MPMVTMASPCQTINQRDNIAKASGGHVSNNMAKALNAGGGRGTSDKVSSSRRRRRIKGKLSNENGEESNAYG